METLNVARECLENKHFKDSINIAINWIEKKLKEVKLC